MAVLDAGCAEPVLDLEPGGLGHGYGAVVQSAEHLGIGAELEPGEVEECQGVAVADVEEEVRRALVVAVLEDLGQREAQQVLVEADRRLDVGRQQGEMMDPPRGGGRAFARRLQMTGPDGLPLIGAVDVCAVSAHVLFSSSCDVLGLRAMTASDMLVQI